MATTPSTSSSATIDASDDTFDECPPYKKQRVQEMPDSSDSAGETSDAAAADVDLPQILLQYQCPVCLEHIPPPILQCPNGHLFCQSCRQRFTAPARCPNCREPVPDKDIRNFHMEHMAENLRLQFPCPHEAYGCPTTTLLSQKLSHEELCDYRPFDCPDPSGLCQWSGIRDEVSPHLISAHGCKNRNASKAEFCFVMDIIIQASEYCWVKLLSFKEQHFLFIMTRECLTSSKLIFKAFVVFIGEQRNANQFRYKLEICRPDSVRPRLYFEDIPVSIRDSVPSLIENGLGLLFDDKMAERFSNDDILKLNLEFSDSESLESETDVINKTSINFRNDSF